ncbi:MAG: hypothetical protein IIW92_02170 [Lachnospiraceae bacterium]|nr:hypothetical protein [Lachnospiraceae bacterium]
MIPWNIKYPVQNGEMINLDWIINKVKELDQSLDELEARVLEAALKATKEYVDEEMADIRREFADLSQQVVDLRNYFDEEVAALQEQYDTFTRAVDNSINRLVNRINAFEEDMRAAIIGVNALTDLKIEQNNEYIMEKIAEGVVNVRVINYFTGERVTVQEMFDTLAQLHLENPITYTELANSTISYAALAALNMTYTELAVKGNSFINP